MLNTNDSQSIEWFIDEKIKPLKKEIKKLQLENKELNEKFSLYGVSKSFTAEQVVNELKENETLDDAISFFTNTK